MSWKRSVATATLGVVLATAALPARASARRHNVYYHVGHEAAEDAGEDIAIGLGITTGVLALVGGAVWYYLHQRHVRARQEPLSPPPDAGAAQPN